MSRRLISFAGSVWKQMMHPKLRLFVLLRMIALEVGLVFFPLIFVSQIFFLSQLIAGLGDTRFSGVSEDYTSPSLKNSNLEPALPVVGYINDYPRYTVELLQVQWRFGDPIDLYVMKPKGVRKPPVILYLYGYPAGTDRFKDETFQKAVTKD